MSNVYFLFLTYFGARGKVCDISSNRLLTPRMKKTTRGLTSHVPTFQHHDQKDGNLQTPRRQSSCIDTLLRLLLMETNRFKPHMDFLKKLPAPQPDSR